MGSQHLKDYMAATEGAVDVVIESALAVDPTQELALARALKRKLGRDVQVSILRYLLDSGQLRVNPDGSLRPLQDMPLRYGDPVDTGLLPQKTADAAVQAIVDEVDRTDK